MLWLTDLGGTLNQTSEDIDEANLDVQYGLTLANALPIDFYSVGGQGMLIPDPNHPTQRENDNEPYLELFTYLNSLPDGQLPHTLSTSYADDEQSVPLAYSQQVCNLIGQLGSRGVSVIFSSGDQGPGAGCQTNDVANATRFVPQFPATCPYVTSVGGTTKTSPEVAAELSSGGFSDRFPRPQWQESAVCNYLQLLGDTQAGLYNATGRGFPDVSAQALGYQVIQKGKVQEADGTSAATPVFAAIVGMLNSARIEAGKPPLGFLNPWLYQTVYPANALNDIMQGGSKGCGTVGDLPLVPFASWNATTGWDPVTGLGTPNFGKMLQLALQA